MIDMATGQGGQIQLKPSQPNLAHLGYADSIAVEEVGGAREHVAEGCNFNFQRFLVRTFDEDFVQVVVLSEL
ncbi:hypothetical protein FRX31_018229 [Thalictrum thalictroides]|uniref:Uncharacterized protein n=1 Tax=Thalictrum thalictroides TaxID=46969 RepID=A0A7J6W471_THATH|nr:hypothetical protein FRX31_018229 [Thalictrum thalictroides]